MLHAVHLPGFSKRDLEQMSFKKTRHDNLQTSFVKTMLDTFSTVTRNLFDLHAVMHHLWVRCAPLSVICTQRRLRLMSCSILVDIRPV